MIIANVTIAFDPTWPWSLPGLGYPALLTVALILVFLTAWTYSGVRKITWRRIGQVMALRLLALCAVFVMVLRPALAFDEANEDRPSRLLILLDYSASMTITDEF